VPKARPVTYLNPRFFLNFIFSAKISLQAIENIGAAFYLRIKQHKYKKTRGNKQINLFFCASTN